MERPGNFGHYKCQWVNPDTVNLTAINSTFLVPPTADAPPSPSTVHPPPLPTTVPCGHYSASPHPYPPGLGTPAHTHPPLTKLQPTAAAESHACEHQLHHSISSETESIFHSWHALLFSPFF